VLQRQKYFFHATSIEAARQFVSNQPTELDPRGKGEFGAGLYFFQHLNLATRIAPEYVRNAGGAQWAVIQFKIPDDIWTSFKNRVRDENYLAFTAYGKKASDITVKHGQSLSWEEFVNKESKTEDRGYSLIKGPLKQVIEGGHPPQYLFSGIGLDVLNDSRVRRKVVAVGEAKHGAGVPQRPTGKVGGPGQGRWKLDAESSSDSEPELPDLEEVEALIVAVDGGRITASSIRGRINRLDEDVPENVVAALRAYNDNRDGPNKAAAQQAVTGWKSG
jgi:hypothetical protein